MTETAQAILGCVKACRWHYGMTMIVDTVHGSRNTKIVRAGMEKNPYYGKCAQVPVYQLRQVMNYLVLNGYIRLTDDEYPVLELNERSEAVLGGERVAMKVAKEQPKSAEKKQKKKKLPAGPEGEV